MNANDKTAVNVTWNAPAAGTGAVDIRFAVVQMRTTYWANLIAATLQGKCRHGGRHMWNTNALRPLLYIITPSAV